MDENNFLIYVKGEDRTAQIQCYEYRDKVVWITYKSSSKEYPTALRDVQILQDPMVTEVSEQMAVYKNRIPLRTACRLLDFGLKVRIQFQDKPSQVCDKTALKVESTGITSGSAKHILQYLSDISQHTNSVDEDTDQKAFLKKQFDNLKFISPSSVLNYYLKGEAVRVNPQLVENSVFPFSFNLSQKEAVDHALRSQVTIIEGPPGTGKTQTILNILANLSIMQNKTVAVVSGNNAAVRNVKDKLEAEGYQFLVAALGNNKNKEKFFANLPQADVSEWEGDTNESQLLKQIHELNVRIQHLMELEKKKAKLQRKLSSYQLEREHFEAYFEKQEVEQIMKLSFYRQSPKSILNLLANHHLATEQGKSEGFFHKSKLLLLYGFTDFKRLRENEVDVVLNLQRKYYELKVEQLTHQIKQLENELSQNEYSLLLKQHKQLSTQLFRHKLFQKYHERPPISATVHSYKQHFEKFIEQYPILLSTTHSLRNCVPENFLFDYVIIDESSQVDLLTGVLALSCCKNVIIVGDTKQLPQIVDQTIQDKLGYVGGEVGEAYDYFQQSLLSSMVTLYDDNIPKVLLKEHYRCHPKIIEFCNQKYYDGELIAFTSESDDDRPLSIYQTVEGNHMREVTRGHKKGKVNQREIDVILHEVLKDPEAGMRKYNEIGFVTPYRKQVEKATSQLATDIESDTIHKFQGREKPVMILSTVLDNSRSGKMGLKFVSDPRMINVAVSRAQQEFILVTDNSLFRKYGNEVGDLIRYMEYSTVNENLTQSEIVSVFDLLYKDHSKKLNDLKSKVRQQSKYQSENIMCAVLDQVLQEEAYRVFTVGSQMRLRNLLMDLAKLDDRETRFVNTRASVDFVIYHKLDKSPVLVIEVDGFAFHENNPAQLERDRLKDKILEKYGLPLLRLATTGSGEEQRIRMKLSELLEIEK